MNSGSRHGSWVTEDSRFSYPCHHDEIVRIRLNLMSIALTDPLSRGPGIGPRAMERCARLGLSTLRDMLLHVPLRYQDRTRVTPIAALRSGDQRLIQGCIEHQHIMGKRQGTLQLLVTDASGTLPIRFFHFTEAQRRGLQAGQCLRCFGEARAGTMGLEMTHPEYQLIDLERVPPLPEHLTPVYPTTEGLAQQQLRRLVDVALSLLQPTTLIEALPAQLLAQRGWPSLETALRGLHRPPPDISPEPLENRNHPFALRLIFDELVAHQVAMRLMRDHYRTLSAPRMVPAQSETLDQRLLNAMPFSLTRAQQRVVSTIHEDLATTRAMLRLVQGDVGSGKTLVAALAALRAIEAGYQVALVAPTSLLAEQQRELFQRWFTPLGVRLATLSRQLGAAERRAQREAIANGQAQMVTGTHALFQEKVQFAKLGLMIVDEQHRFGVHQRLELFYKGMNGELAPHQLVMTATPIPRSLAMAAYADLDLSVIDELPPGRTPVVTAVAPDQRRDEVIERIRLRLAKGAQAYWVCTLVEESESLQCQAAEDTAGLLRAALPEFSVGLVHGRLKNAEKDAVMSAFRDGKVQLLVATTVIEVGVDVPNASLMIIENAERLGLAQLHQLRGRVGRGATESHCLLLYHAPLSEAGRQRLGILRESNDGFVIAQRDLELRGPGEVLGTRQTGLMQYRIADVQRDQALLELAREVAGQLAQEAPEMAGLLMQQWVSRKGEYAGV